MAWHRKRMSYEDAKIIQKHIVLALIGVSPSDEEELAKHPDPDISNGIRELEELADELSAELAQVQVHVQR